MAWLNCSILRLNVIPPRVVLEAPAQCAKRHKWIIVELTCDFIDEACNPTHHFGFSLLGILHYLKVEF